MARPCTICTSPSRHDIERALIDGEQLRTIAESHGLSSQALIRHRDVHLPRLLAENATPLAIPESEVVPEPKRNPTRSYAVQRQQDERAHAMDLLMQLARQVERINLLSDAADRWLRDPGDSSQYSIDPRGYEVQVIYEDLNDTAPSGTPKRKKATLQALLDRVDGQGSFVDRAEVRFADPRELVLKTAGGGLKDILQLGMTYMERLHGAKQTEAFEQAVIETFAEVSPDAQSLLLSKLRRLRHPAGLPDR